MKYPVYICHDIPVGSKQAMIAINFSGAFIEVAGAYKTIVGGLSFHHFFYKANFCMHFHIGHAQQYFHAGFFQLFFPFQVGFFIKSCP